MMVDLSTGGATLPLIVAGVSGLLAWLFLSRRKSASGEASPSIGGTVMSGLSGLLGGSKVSLVTLLITIWTNRQTIIGLLSKAWSGIQPILSPPSTPPVVAPPTTPPEGGK